MMMSGMTPTKNNWEDAKWIETKQDDAGMTHHRLMSEREHPEVE
jgi:hypothetical protein